MKSKIKLKNSSWSFGKKVPKSFESHIIKSVPFYKEGHKIITGTVLKHLEPLLPEKN